MKVTALKVNAFSKSPHGGNPAGVVIDPPDLTDNQMKQISKQLAVSETAFVSASNVADYNVRFFSPTSEVDLCGHATIATFFTLAEHGRVSSLKKQSVTQETKAGILSIDIYYNEDKTINKIMMTQKKPIYKDIHFNISLIADSLHINAEDIDDSLPQQIVSTGLFTLPICIKSYDILKQITPDFKKVKKICEMIGAGSFHTYSFETLEPNSIYHARNFAPVYGINEDPVTGTANGAVCSYLVHHSIIKDTHLICEQGDIIGRPGRVYVEIGKDVVKVGGNATIIEKREIDV